MLFPMNAWRFRPRFFTFDNLTIISPLEEFSNRGFFSHRSNDSSSARSWSAPFFLFSSLLFFFLHMRHRDHRATKVEQTLPGEEGKENRCRGGKRDRGERERGRREGEFTTQRVTDNFYFSRLIGIDTTFHGRAVFLSDQHWRSSASPWFFIGGGVIRLEPRPTENSSLFLRVFFRHALPLFFPPTYNVRPVNWTRSHRDCVHGRRGTHLVL